MTTWRKHIQLTGLMALILLLVACGFKLRGSSNLPPELKTLFVTGNAPYNPVTLAYKNQLPHYDVQVVDSAEKSPITLYITDINYGQNNESLGGSEQSEQYKISYNVRYRLQDAEGRILVPEQSVSAVGHLSTNANEVVSSTTQLQDVQQSLQTQLVMNTIYQLSSAKTKKALAVAAAAPAKNAPAAPAD